MPAPDDLLAVCALGHVGGFASGAGAISGDIAATWAAGHQIWQIVSPLSAKQTDQVVYLL